MNHRHRSSVSLLSVAAAFALISAVSLAAQTTPSTSTAKAASATAGNALAAPSVKGSRDLSGIWNNSSLTPLQRPVELGNKAYFTPEEAAAFEKSQAQQVNRDRRDGSADTDVARAYNEVFFDRGTKLEKTRRTSLVIDPPDGRIPSLTPEAQKKYDAIHAFYSSPEHIADSPEGRPLQDRCLMFSQVGPPMLPGNYNDNFEIVQTPDNVAILVEMRTQMRIIPLDGRPHLPGSVQQWNGDSRGHWEGNTLVVDTTNIRSNDQSHFGFVYDGMSDQNLHVTERFTRTDPSTIIYRATVDDPTVYTKPWTIEVVLAKSEEPLYEYACHEGNYGLADMLSAARAEEKKAAGQGSK